MMPLVWKEQFAAHADHDPEYVTYRAVVAYSGKVRVAQIRTWYGDANSASSRRGTVQRSEVRGRFRHDWASQGYTWKLDHPYIPACADDQVPVEWVEQKWAQFLNDAGLKETAG